MAVLTVENLSFKYEHEEILRNISLTVEMGQFITLFGATGSGKSTLLKLLKPEMRPNGKLTGIVKFEDEELTFNNSLNIGYVAQRPQEQIVMETVWQELAFGLENIGIPHNEMQQKIGEVASFFGIHKWLYKSTTELSGGQLQLLNLAAVLLMEPKLLLLDEPTSQLDPIAAEEFIQMLYKINRELGITIVVIEHRLEQILAITDRVLFMKDGHLLFDATAQTIGHLMKNEPMFKALPAATQMFCAVSNEKQSAVTIKEGIQFISKFEKQQLVLQESKKFEPYIEVNDLYFRYMKNAEDIIANASFSIGKGEIFSIVGGNGVGKSTLLSILAKINKAYKGKIKIAGQLFKKSEEKIVLLPQNPQLIFMKSTVQEELQHMYAGPKEAIFKMCEQFGLTHLMKKNPFDLSGGEQQKVALAKILLLQPNILLLDEPTKGVDAAFKQQYKRIIRELQQQGLTIIIVTHDIDFAAHVSNQCALFFDKQLVATNTPQKFFSRNHFYTTAACRIARHRFLGAITTEEVINCCQQQINGGVINEQHFS